MSKTFSKTDLKFIFGIGYALALRQLGLIMVMPFLSIYGKELSHNTPGLIGLSLGIYGLSQAFFQIPFGSLSDKLGRKPVILFGMFLFISGLFLAYLAKSIYTFILARVLQGSGAIMAVAYSWIGDNIIEEKRNKGMSIIGMLMGISAIFAFIGGPIIYKWFNVPQMFLLCALLSFLAWLYILFFLEENKDKNKSEKLLLSNNFGFYQIMQHKRLIQLFSSGFITNYILVSEFFIVPQLLEKSLGVNGLWKVFVPATLIAILAMGTGTKLADAGHLIKVTAVSFILISLGSLAYFTTNLYLIGLGLILFMSGYMCLVTLLPSSVTKLSEKNYRGKVTGIFNTLQFIGSFIGGSWTGFLWGINPFYSILSLMIISVIGAIISSTQKDQLKIKPVKES